MRSSPRGATDEASRSLDGEAQKLLAGVSPSHEWPRALGRTHTEEASGARANARAQVRARA